VNDIILAVDLGGTRMRAALVACDGHVLERRAEPTPHDARYPGALMALAGGMLVGASVSGAVIGVPGRVDYEGGQLEYAPNLPAGWAEELSERHLTSVLDVPVALANDADLAAVGEARFGAGRSYRDLVYLTISTGVGVGVILGERLLRGRLSLAELGHTVIDREACARGEPATVEGLASGTALAREAAAAGLEPDAAALVELVRAGDDRARRVWDRGVEAAAIGVLNLAHLFSPEVVVIGGGVGRTGPMLLDPIRSFLATHGPRGLRRPIEVVPATLGDDAGLLGAAGWWMALGPAEVERRHEIVGNTRSAHGGAVGLSGPQSGPGDRVSA
jgi:glucokinase